jgi:hypothetical protein
MASSTLKSEFDYYVAHQDELAMTYRGKFIVLKNCTVIGAYDSELEAVRESAKSHEMGTFLVQKCEEGKQNYTQSFHSRVAFA